MQGLLLAGLFHTLSAAAYDLLAPTVLRSIRVLDLGREYAGGLEPSRALSRRSFDHNEHHCIYASPQYEVVDRPGGLPGATVLP